MKYYIRLKYRKECFLISIKDEILSWTSVKTDIESKAGLSEKEAFEYKRILTINFGIEVEMISGDDLYLGT